MVGGEMQLRRGETEPDPVYLVEPEFRDCDDDSHLVSRSPRAGHSIITCRLELGAPIGSEVSTATVRASEGCAEIADKNCGLGWRASQ